MRKTRGGCVPPRNLSILLIKVSPPANRLPHPRPPLSSYWLASLALLLALGHAGLATFATLEKSTTADELAHVTGGYTFNHWHDYRLHPENGILPQRWQALPAALMDPDFPALSTPGWRKSVVWLVGYDFFYQSRNDPAWLLFTARAMNSLFGAATVLLVFFWGADLRLFLCALSDHAGAQWTGDF